MGLGAECLLNQSGMRSSTSSTILLSSPCLSVKPYPPGHARSVEVPLGESEVMALERGRHLERPVTDG